ncbi:MAG TPA: AraC family transcriptional regulator [Caulobacteraceae bacterium]|jgi:AraC-like DNA-binding protein|nr:AraC family transcriptional regulator [Caulobacteraceae bacterium]
MALAATYVLDWNCPPAGGIAEADVDSRRLLAPSRAALRLLGDGLRALDEDRATARTCLVHARRLLQEVVDTGAPAASQRRERGGLLVWQIRRVTAHIEANLDAALANADLAPLARLNPQYFAHAFRRSLGVGPHAYVVGRRIARAQEMMLVSEEPLSQIALACGFSDQPHFTRAFRTAVGETPRAWQRRHATATPPGRTERQERPQRRAGDEGQAGFAG